MLYIFAEVPAPQAGELGSWLLSLAIILVIVDSAVSVVKAIWFPSRALDSSNLASKTEVVILNQNVLMMKEQIAGCMTRVDLTRLETQMMQIVENHKDLAKHTFNYRDKVTESIADLRVAQETIRREIRDETMKLGAMLVAKIETASKTATESHKQHRE